ncbi:MAG: ABC transporter ATP-binding protein [Lentisphaerae bacterium]|nr:MAG: ABC transporter ATP-binding protein [Lentisphaerota bacterium]
MTDLQSESPSPVIDLQNVAKTYRGGVQALKGISMQVHAGEIFGLLGPNGAGKSTLVKILMTIIHPTQCHGTMLGEPVGTKRVLAWVGYLPEHLQFPPYLTGEQALHIYGALAKVPRHLRKERIPRLLKLLNMQEWGHRKIGIYSKGMKQRVGLAQALINDPELVILDEPTDGVDPVGRREMRNIMVQLKQAGKAVFVNSHILSELELVCDRVAILSKGAVVAQGTLEELTKGSRRYEITLASPLPESETLQQTLQALQAEYVASESKTQITVPTNEASAIQPLIDALRQSGGVIEAVKPIRQSLEDYFITAVQEAEENRETGDKLQAVQSAVTGRNSAG